MQAIRTMSLMLCHEKTRAEGSAREVRLKEASEEAVAAWLLSFSRLSTFLFSSSSLEHEHSHDNSHAACMPDNAIQPIS